jgi:excisionase family DNA binding protein
MDMAEARRLAPGAFVRVSEAAAHLGISRSKLYQMMDAGELVYAKFGKSRRIPREALEELARRALVVRS